MLAGRHEHVEASTNIKLVVLAAKPVEEQVAVDLRLDEDKIDEEDDVIVLDIFVGKQLTARALSQTDTLAEGAVIGLAVGGIEMGDWIAALDAYWHGFWAANIERRVSDSARGYG